MKKTLIAAAVVAASGAAMAQSSVQIYGTVDVWAGSSGNKTTLSGVETKESFGVVNSGGLTTSRIGFRGTEDLGGGLAANFKLESRLGVDTGAAFASGFDRESWVGLSGGFGEIQLGNTWTAYDDIWGATNHTFDDNFTAVPRIGYNAIPGSTIKYYAPVFSGVTAAVSYSLGEADVDSPDVTSFSLNYDGGPLNVVFGYQREEFASPEIYGFGIALGTVEKFSNTLIGASYDFGVAKLLGNYNQAKVEDASFAADITLNEYSVGVEVPLGDAMAFSAGYGRSQAKQSGVKLIKASGVSAALTYTLSKRTTAYAGFNRTTFTDEGVNNAGDKVRESIYAVGIKHTF